MTQFYTVNLVNQTASVQMFWCFLAPPPELANDPSVFANSSTSLAISPNSPGTDSFTIPVQYVVGAGASNNAVGLNVRVNASVTQNASLGDSWQAGYVTVPPNMGPVLRRSSSPAPQNAIAISSNSFNQMGNEANGWFGNMSFGIQTGQGFMGMTWSPWPQQVRTLTPVLNFYIATGAFGNNSLASWNDVESNTAMVRAPDSFANGQCTVTYTQSGAWIVTPGAPQ